MDAESPADDQAQPHHHEAAVKAAQSKEGKPKEMRQEQGKETTERPTYEEAAIKRMAAIKAAVDSLEREMAPRRSAAQTVDIAALAIGMENGTLTAGEVVEAIQRQQQARRDLQELIPLAEMLAKSLSEAQLRETFATLSADQILARLERLYREVKQAQESGESLAHRWRTIEAVELDAADYTRRKPAEPRPVKKAA